jgi:hypothetical protein
VRLRSRFSAVLSLVLLFAVPTLADESVQVFVHPRVPTTATPIQFYFAQGCPPKIGTPTREGSVIRIRFEMHNCSPPITATYTVALPEKTLPAGQYRVELVQIVDWDSTRPPVDVLVASAVFTVHEADPQPFRIRPAVAFNAGGPVRIERTDGRDVCGGQCTFLFGGIAGTLPTYHTDGSVTVHAPALAPGVHDVSIVFPAAPTITAKGAWYVFDESIKSHVDRSQFEHVLIPLLFNGPGANGSQWRSELVIANNSPSPIPLGYIDRTPSQIWRNYALAPQAYQTDFGFLHPFGSVLLVPRRGAEGLAMSLRVRDVSREAEGFGTEIPIVREQDMAEHRGVTLLNVPLDTKYRAKLRVYAILPDARATDVLLQIKPRAGELATSTRFVPLRRDCGGLNQACSDTPLYGEFDLPNVANGRADLQLGTVHGALLWAFVSVTNNHTQQVTVVTPSDKGDVDCIVCN